MTRAQLAQKIAFELRVSQSEAGRYINCFLNAIVTGLKQDRFVEVRNFGTFRISERPERIGRNPRTSEPVKIPARKVPRFKAGLELKRRVNRKGIGVNR